MRSAQSAVSFDMYLPRPRTRVVGAFPDGHSALTWWDKKSQGVATIVAHPPTNWRRRESNMARNHREIRGSAIKAAQNAAQSAQGKSLWTPVWRPWLTLGRSCLR